MQGELIRIGWGRDDPSFRLYFSSTFMPDAAPQLWSDFAALMRRTTSAENALRLNNVSVDMDVREAAQVTVPTLILHGRNEVRIPFSQGRELATRIRGSRLVPLDTRNHLLQPDEPAWEHLLRDRRLPRRGRVHEGVHREVHSQSTTGDARPAHGGPPQTDEGQPMNRTHPATSTCRGARRHRRRRRRRSALRRGRHGHAAWPGRARRARPRPSELPERHDLDARHRPLGHGAAGPVGRARRLVATGAPPVVGRVHQRRRLPVAHDQGPLRRRLPAGARRIVLDDILQEAALAAGPASGPG